MTDMTVRDNPSEPERPGHWRFCGTALWGVLIFIVWMGVQTSVVIVSVLRSMHGKVPHAQLAEKVRAATENGTLISVAIIMGAVVCLPLTVGIIKLKRRSDLREYLGLRLVPMRTALKFAAIYVLIDIISDVYEYMHNGSLVPKFVTDTYNSTHPVWILWLSFVIAAPLFEELYFRGFLLKGFASSFMGPVMAVLITATLFAAGHLQYDTTEMAIIWCGGLLYGTARVRTGSLLLPVLMHIANNLEATIEAAFLR